MDYLDYTFDFTHWLEGEKIATSMLSIGTNGLQSVRSTSTTVVFLLSMPYKRTGSVSCVVTTSSGRVRTQYMHLKEGRIVW